MDMMTLKTRCWVALIPAMLLPSIAAFFYFILLSENNAARWIYGFTKVCTLVWPFFCVLFLFKEKLPKISFEHFKRFNVIALGTLSGITIVFLMYLLLQTPITQVMSENIHLIRAKAIKLGFIDHYWSFALFLALGNSLMEEYYWRWFVFGYLRQRLNFSLSMLLGSLAFGAHHFVVLSQYYPFQWTLIFGSAVVLGGIFWCFLYEKQKTLLGCWISHIIVDLGFLCIGHQFLFQP
jgi:uncharacterized protein